MTTYVSEKDSSLFSAAAVERETFNAIGNILLPDVKAESAYSIFLIVKGYEASISREAIDAFVMYSVSNRRFRVNGFNKLKSRFYPDDRIDFETHAIRTTIPNYVATELKADNPEKKYRIVHFTSKDTYSLDIDESGVDEYKSVKLLFQSGKTFGTI